MHAQQFSGSLWCDCLTLTHCSDLMSVVFRAPRGETHSVQRTRRIKTRQLLVRNMQRCKHRGDVVKVRNDGPPLNSNPCTKTKTSMCSKEKKYGKLSVPVTPPNQNIGDIFVSSFLRNSAASAYVRNFCLRSSMRFPSAGTAD